MRPFQRESNSFPRKPTIFPANSDQLQNSMELSRRILDLFSGSLRKSLSNKKPEKLLIEHAGNTRISCTRWVALSILLNKDHRCPAKEPVVDWPRGGDPDIGAGDIGMWQPGPKGAKAAALTPGYGAADSAVCRKTLTNHGEHPCEIFTKSEKPLPGSSKKIEIFLYLWIDILK